MLTFSKPDAFFAACWGRPLRWLYKLTHQSNFWWSRVLLTLGIASTMIYIELGTISSFQHVSNLVMGGIFFFGFRTVIVPLFESWAESPTQDSLPILLAMLGAMVGLMRTLFSFVLVVMAGIWLEYALWGSGWLIIGQKLVILLMMGLVPAGLYSLTEIQPKRPSRLKAAAHKLRQALTPKQRFVPRPTFG